MKKNFTLLKFIGFILCFILFVVSMLLADQFPLLILFGILGFVGFCYFIFRIVLNIKTSNPN